MRAFSRFHRHLGVESPNALRTRPALLALGAGTLAAIAKTVAAVITGSASMLAEAVRSWVETVTGCFLVAAYVAARKPADASRPLGYGRDSYVWSLFASIATFVVGAEVGIWRGLTQLGSTDATTHYRLGYVVIAVSLLLEGASFLQALRFVRQRAAEQERSVVAHVFHTSDAQLRTVFTEDFIALLGLAIAALGMALHEATGEVIYDAIGSVLIGVLMVLAGLVLINLNRQFLAGMPLSAEQRATAIGLLESLPEIEKVTFFFAEFIGPERIVIAARVMIAGEHSQAELAQILRSLENHVMTHPNVSQAILTLALPEEPGA